MDAIQRLLHYRTPLCTHDHGCLLAAFSTALKNVKYGLLVSGILQLIRTLKMLGKNPSGLSQSFKSKYFTIALFMCATVLTLRLVRCALRHWREKDDGANSLLAGAAAGWVASRTLDREYWYFYLTFIGSRVIGALHKYLIAKGTLKEENTHWHSFFMMAIAHGVHSTGYFLHPYMLRDDMYGLYLKMSASTPTERKWHLGFLKYKHRRIG
jgi:hypothetical protein